MNAVYKKMIAVIKTIIVSLSHKVHIKTNIKKAVRKISFGTACGPSWA